MDLRSSRTHHIAQQLHLMTIPMQLNRFQPWCISEHNRRIRETVIGDRRRQFRFEAAANAPSCGHSILVLITIENRHRWGRGIRGRRYTEHPIAIPDTSMSIPDTVLTGSRSVVYRSDEHQMRTYGSETEIEVDPVIRTHIEIGDYIAGCDP